MMTVLYVFLGAMVSVVAMLTFLALYTPPHDPSLRDLDFDP